MTHGMQNNLIQVTDSDIWLPNALYNLECVKHGGTNVIIESSHNLLRGRYCLFINKFYRSNKQSTYYSETLFYLCKYTMAAKWK